MIINCPEGADLIELSNQSLVFEKEHAYVGDFSTGDAQFTLDASALTHIANETNKYISAGNEVNLPIEHTDDPEKNRGRAFDFSVRIDSNGRTGLFSKVEFRDDESAVLAKTAKTSIFCPSEYTDGKGTKYIRPVRHVALTDYPVIPGLEGFKPIVASLIQNRESKMPLLNLLWGYFWKRNPEPIKASQVQIAMLLENRSLKLSQLVKEGAISPAVEKKLKDIFCASNRLSLCLSQNFDDSFNAIVDALKENKGFKFSELSGNQSVSFGQKNNPMMAAAEKRATALKG